MSQLLKFAGVLSFTSVLHHLSCTDFVWIDNPATTHKSLIVFIYDLISNRWSSKYHFRSWIQQLAPYGLILYALTTLRASSSSGIAKLDGSEDLKVVNIVKDSNQDLSIWEEGL